MDELITFEVVFLRETKGDIRVGIDIVDQFIKKYRIDTLPDTDLIVDRDLITYHARCSPDHHIHPQLIHDLVAVRIVDGDPRW